MGEYHLTSAASGFGPSFSGYPHRSLKGRATTLIHETAHLLKPADPWHGLRVFQPDFGIPAAGQANDQAVHEHCHVLIDGLQ